MAKTATFLKNKDLISSVQKFMQNMREEMQSISLRKKFMMLHDWAKEHEDKYMLGACVRWMKECPGSWKFSETPILRRLYPSFILKQMTVFPAKTQKWSLCKHFDRIFLWDWTLDKNVWQPYIFSMSDQEFQQTKLGHSIQESLHNKNSDSDAARLRRGHTSYSLFSLVAKFTEIEQQSRFFGTDVEIHNAEIHMIMAIHDVEGIHVTGLADRLHITKGSVSELLRKLEQKKLIHKDTDSCTTALRSCGLRPCGTARQAGSRRTLSISPTIRPFCTTCSAGWTSAHASMSLTE